jgi:hypothetical protein
VDRTGRAISSLSIEISLHFSPNISFSWLVECYKHTFSNCWLRRFRDATCWLVVFFCACAEWQVITENDRKIQWIGMKTTIKKWVTGDNSKNWPSQKYFLCACTCGDFTNLFSSIVCVVGPPLLLLKWRHC